MTAFHGVFPYLVSPIDAGGRIKTDVLGSDPVPPQAALTIDERNAVAAVLESL